ncbi:MAG: MoaD/ThiS family protein [Limnochordia bacterium]|jgi:molybdopterin synthase sulfur carrier subunit
MQVMVKLFGMMRDRFESDKLTLELAEGATLADARQALGIKEEEEGYLITMVNGKYAQLEHPLQDGDEITLFPPVSGG